MTSLTIKLFLDGADLASITRLAPVAHVAGFTTNPSLMRKAGVSDYAAFARQAIEAVGTKPISFEVFSDDFDRMEAEARVIHSWGGPVYVKIPIANSRGESSLPLIQRLAGEGVALNITAILTLPQVEGLSRVLNPEVPSLVSVFAGRIADTGRDPIPTMRASAEILKPNPKAELLWASTREFYNVIQAQECGCHVITAPADVIAKLPLMGKDLDAYSLETVKSFLDDAQAAGFRLI